ncbi:tetratricopeptide repeat protein [Chloroflexota bacterium]
MSHKRVIIPATCILLSVTMLALGCGNSEDEDILKGDFRLAMLQFYRSIAEHIKVIDLPPSFYATSYYSRGLDYEHRGEHDKAIACYTEAIELDPDDALNYYSRGNSYNSKGEYDKAIADYTKAIELEPEYAHIYYKARAHTYESKGEYDKAIADYTKIIELKPENAWAYYYRGDAYYSKGEYDKAASDYEKVIQIATDGELVEDARQALEAIGK